MVMATFSTQLFFSALGSTLSEQELSSTLFSLGMELDSFSEEEFVVEITPERLDLLSVQGLARAVGVFLGSKKVSEYVVHDSSYVVNVSSTMKQVRPYTVCAVVKNLSFSQESLDALIAFQEKLHDTLGRKRLRGAIGVYPLDKISWPISFDAGKDFTFQPLDGEEMSVTSLCTEHETGKKYAHLLDGLYPFFQDASGTILSVPPVINSESVGRVTLDTTEVFIECSGSDLSVLKQQLTLLVTSLAEQGGAIYAVEVSYPDETMVTPVLSSSSLSFNTSLFEKTIGISLPDDEMRNHLERMMHTVDADCTVHTPCFRFDIWHPVDLVDDIARSYGYNNIPLRLPHVTSLGSQLPESILVKDLTEELVGLGFLEVVTFSLNSKEDHFTKMNIPEHEHVQIVNGLESQALLRTSLFSQQLSLLAHNQQRQLPQKIFELDQVTFLDSTTDVRARNDLVCSMMITDSVVSFTQMRQVVDAVLRAKGFVCEITPLEDPRFIPGRAGTVSVNGVEIGVLGELSPSVLEQFGLQTPVVACELFVGKLV